MGRRRLKAFKTSKMTIGSLVKPKMDPQRATSIIPYLMLEEVYQMVEVVSDERIFPPAATWQQIREQGEIYGRSRRIKNNSRQ
jgi:hypothetical protein